MTGGRDEGGRSTTEEDTNERKNESFFYITSGIGGQFSHNYVRFKT
jgi:hypothetical protein